MKHRTMEDLNQDEGYETGSVHSESSHADSGFMDGYTSDEASEAPTVPGSPDSGDADFVEPSEAPTAPGTPTSEDEGTFRFDFYIDDEPREENSAAPPAQRGEGDASRGRGATGYFTIRIWPLEAAVPSWGQVTAARDALLQELRELEATLATMRMARKVLLLKKLSHFIGFRKGQVTSF